VPAYSYSSRNLDKLLAQLEPQLRREFLRSLLAIQDERRMGELAEMLAGRRIDEALTVVRREMAVFSDAVNRAYIAAGDRAAPFVSDRLGVAVRFQPQSDAAVRAMRNNDLRIVGGLTREQEAATRQALVSGVEEGLNPLQQARRFRDSIGLTQTQEAAVRNYRRLLEQGSPEALNRALRDRRFDGSVGRAVAGDRPLSADQVDRMVGRYRERYIAYRSEVIARTEALRAVHAGTDELFRQVADSGKIRPQSLERVWVAAIDGETRDTHRAMHNQARSLGQPFRSPSGALLAYPGDPSAPIEETAQCRCVLTTRFEPSSRGTGLAPPPVAPPPPAPPPPAPVPVAPTPAPAAPVSAAVGLTRDEAGKMRHSLDTLLAKKFAPWNYDVRQELSKLVNDRYQLPSQFKPTNSSAFPLTVESTKVMPDAYGMYSPRTGVMTIRRDVAEQAREFLKAVEENREMLSREADSFQTFIHEQVHSVGRGAADSYWGSGAVIEEVTTEVLARKVMRDQFGELWLADGAKLKNNVKFLTLGQSSYQRAIDGVVDAIRRALDVTRAEAAGLLEEAALLHKREAGHILGGAEGAVRRFLEKVEAAALARRGTPLTDSERENLKRFVQDAKI